MDRSAISWALVVSLGSLCCLTACPDDERQDDDPPQPDGVPIDRVEAEQAALLCKLIFRCDAAAVDRLVYRDEAECKAWIEREGTFDVADLKKAVTAGALRYDGKAAAECLSALDSCSALGLSEHEQPEACQRSFVGTVAIGGACHASEECTGEAYCQESGAGPSHCPGACAPTLALGAECRSTAQCPRTGLTGHRECVFEGNIGTCRDVSDGPAALENGACGFDLTTNVETECGPGLWCSFGGPAGTCRKEIAPGASCDPQSDRCQGAHACAVGAGGYTCQPMLLARESGDGCDEVVTFCSPLDGLACLNRVCMASRPPGGPLGAECDRSDYSAPCDPGLYCQGQQGARTCQPKVAEGAVCDQLDACLDGACDLAICRARACSAI
jgi:hypothetical protein